MSRTYTRRRATSMMHLHPTGSMVAATSACMLSGG